MNANDIKTWARQHGADLVGIASADRFSALAPDRSPLSIFPECRSVIVVGRRILRGALRGVEEGTSFQSTYGLFGFRWLEDNFLSRTAYDLTCRIEAEGFEAVPIFGYSPDDMPKGIPVEQGKPAPNVIPDLEFAAQAAGLGEVGMGGFFLTPEYGPRQRFSMILTDALLDADPVADKHICGDCGLCASACPFGAIDRANLTMLGVPGHTMQVAAVDYAKCRACPNGATSGPGRGSRPDRGAAACVRACVVQLEQKDKLSNRFVNRFRKRTPWTLDAFRQPIPAEAAGTNPADIGCRGVAQQAR